jgi:O-antigen/teichoic acid export membrane protein
VTHTIKILIQGIGAALMAQILNLGITYLTQIFFARWLGVADYGLYEYAITIATTLSFMAGLGLSSMALRFVSQYLVQQNWAHLRGMVWGTWCQVALAGTAIALAGSGLVLLLHHGQLLTAIAPLLLSLWMVPLLALSKLQLEMSRGIQRIGLAYLPSLAIYPLLLLMGTAWIQLHWNLTPARAMGTALVTLLVVVGLQFFLFQRSLPAVVHRTPPTFLFRKWLLVALPMLFIDGSYMLLNQTDTLMIGTFLNPTAVGVYSAAFKTAAWVHFILVAVNAIAAPLFASLYTQNKLDELQVLVSTIARWMFYPALTIGVGLILFAEPLLSLFGPAFVTAKWTLIVLIIGQLINVGSGSVGYLLMMTGHQNQCAKVVGWSGLLNIILNSIWIPLFGILGAGMATAVSMSLWNIWMHRLVVKHLGIDPSILAGIRP